MPRQGSSTNHDSASPVASSPSVRAVEQERAVLAQGTTWLQRGPRISSLATSLGLCVVVVPSVVAILDIGGKGLQARALLMACVAVGLLVVTGTWWWRGTQSNLVLPVTPRSAAALGAVLLPALAAIVIPWVLSWQHPWTGPDLQFLHRLSTALGGLGSALASTRWGAGLASTSTGTALLWLLTLLGAGGMALMVMDQQPARARRLLCWLVAFGAAHAAVAVVLAPFAPSFPGGGYSGRVRGTFVSPNEAVAFWSMLLPSALLLWARYGAPWGWCVTALGVAIIGSGSRGGVLSAVAVVAPLGWMLLPPRRRWAWAFLALLGLAIAGAAINLRPLEGRFDELAQEHAQHEITLSGRVTIWRDSLPLIAQAGPWGTGPGTTMLAWRRSGGTIFEPQPLGHLHSDPLELLLEDGWAGAALVALGWVIAAVLVLRGMPSERWRRSALLGPALGLATLLLHSSADFLFENEALALTALVLVLILIVTATAVEEAPLGHTARIARHLGARSVRQTTDSGTPAPAAVDATAATAAAEASGEDDPFDAAAATAAAAGAAPPPPRPARRRTLPSGLVAGAALLGAVVLGACLPWEIARARADDQFTTTARLVSGPEASTPAATAARAALRALPLPAGAPVPSRCPFAAVGLAGDARLLALRAQLDLADAEQGADDAHAGPGTLADPTATAPATGSVAAAADPRSDAAAALRLAAEACPAEPRAWLARARLALDLDHPDGVAAADCLDRVLAWAPAWMYGAQEAYALLARDDATVIPAARRAALLRQLLTPDLPVPLTAAIAAARDLGEPALETLVADGRHERLRASLVGWLRVHGSLAAWRSARAAELRLHPRALAPAEAVVGMLMASVPQRGAAATPVAGSTSASMASVASVAVPVAPALAGDDGGSTAAVAIAPSALERVAQSTSLQEAGLPIPEALAQALRNDGTPWSLWAMPIDCFQSDTRERLRRLGDAGERWAATWAARAELAAHVGEGDTSGLSVGTDPILLQGALQALAQGTVRTAIPGEVDRIRLACARYRRPSWQSIPGVTWAWVEQDAQTPPVVISTSGWMGLVIDGVWQGWRRGAFDVRPLLTPGLHRVDLLDG